MVEETVIKVNSNGLLPGEHGQIYLAAGKSLSMRLWQEGQREIDKSMTIREYETAGYVISGRAELEMMGQTIQLEPGDSWIVPKETEHRYRVLDHFVAIEATSPPARISGRDL